MHSVYYTRMASVTRDGLCALQAPPTGAGSIADMLSNGLGLHTLGNGLPHRWHGRRAYLLQKTWLSKPKVIF